MRQKGDQHTPQEAQPQLSQSPAWVQQEQGPILTIDVFALGIR